MQQYFLLPSSIKTSRLLYLLLIMLAGTGMFTSCVGTKNSAYFKTLKKDTTITGLVTSDLDSKIQKKDVLNITVSSLNKEIDATFNAGSTIGSSVQSASGTITAGYPVNERGLINIHFLGEFKAEGLTRHELKLQLEKALLPYMKEPIANVQYLNHKITVLGEVVKPQVLSMPEEQLTLIDVIVLSGDVKENASRRNIMIIRDEKDGKQIKHLNLEDHSIFQSSWYYVKPNDIVYVLPDSEKYVKEEKRRKLQTTLSLVASFTSLIVIILNVILR